jgi:peptidoglycan glycosyltransferase
VNKTVRRMAVVVLLMFGALLVNVNYIQVVQVEQLRTQPGNSRLILEEYSRERGPIIVAGNEVAFSVPTPDERLEYLRRYEQGELYAHTTGYYSFIYGSTGIESALSGILAGTDDRLFVRRILDVLTGEQARGGSVTLTLDPAAQEAAVAGLGSQKGAVVALDPTTGAILAMASTPSYDPNVLSSHDGDAITEAYNRLTEDEDEPLLNRAISQTYPPGSTFKIVTAAAALESGTYDPDTEVYGDATLDLPQTTVDLPNFGGNPCRAGEGDAPTLTDALRQSCNTAFGAIGLELGADPLREQAQAFGFGTRFSVPMTTAPSRFPDDVNEPQTAQSAIGQFDVQATPLQMAMVVGAVANNGVVMAPYLVSELRGPDFTPLDRADPEELSRAVSPAVADQLTQMLVEVVEEGTGSNAQIPGVEVAGKTGTAQQGPDEPPHAWFVSFAPAEDPRVAVAVVIEDGGGQPEISGNRLAAPVARSVMEAVLAR